MEGKIIFYKYKMDNKCIMKFLLVMYLFIYIFSPPVIHNTRLILDVVNFFIFLAWIVCHKHVCVSFRKINTILPFLPFVIYIWMNGLYLTFIEGPDAIIAYPDFEFIRTAFLIIYLMFRVFLLCFVLKIFIDKMQLSMDEYSDLVILAGMLQFICVLLAFIFPSVRDIFLSMINANTEGAVQKSIWAAMTNEQRCYGFADNIFDSIGYVAAFITAISIIKAVSRRDIKYYITSLCLIFISVMNTRTGVVLDGLCIMMVVLFFFKNNIIKNICMYCAVVFFMVIMGFYVSSLLPQETEIWLFGGMEAVYNLVFMQEYTGIFLEFYLNHLNFPNDILFGDGAIPDATYYNVSDIGYVQCIWYYGLIGTVILMLGILYFFYYNYKKSTCNRELKCFVLCSAVIFFVYLIKLFSLYNLGGYAVFVPIMIMNLIERNRA